MGEIVESFLTFELLIFLFCCIGLGHLAIIVSECKKVLFAGKSDKCDRHNKIGVDVLIRLCCSRLGAVIILFLGFYLFAAIVDESLCIIDEFNVVVCKMFFQCGEVKIAEFLIL